MARYIAGIITQRPWSSICCDMDSAIRRINKNISWRSQRQHLSPASFRALIDQLDDLAARRGNHDGLFAFHVNQLNAMTAFGDYAFDVVPRHVFWHLDFIIAHSVHPFLFPESLARRGVYTVPEGADDI